MSTHPLNNGVHVVTAEQSLQQLASQINHSYQAATSSITRGIQQYRHVGNLLIQAKAKVPKKWAEWFEKNCEFSIREAQRYMKIAKQWEHIEAKLESSGGVSLEEAISIISSGGDEESRIENTTEMSYCKTNCLELKTTTESDVETVCESPQTVSGTNIQTPILSERAEKATNDQQEVHELSVQPDGTVDVAPAPSPAAPAVTNGRGNGRIIGDLPPPPERNRSSSPPAEGTPSAQASFDMKAFDSHLGVCVRDIDKLGKAYGAKESSQAKNLRRILGEYRGAFEKWHQSLQTAASASLE